MTVVAQRLSPRAYRALKYALAGLMTAIGIAHFAVPEPFLKIVPAYLPAPLMLVYVSGFFEVCGGLGLLQPATRRLAAWGLVALFVAVFPANVHQAMHDIAFDPAHPLPSWALWGRLPLQLGFIGWALQFTRREEPQ